MDAPGSSVLVFGAFRLSASERVLYRGSRPVDLTPKAFDTLLTLVENAGHVVSKDALMRAVWPDTAVEENNLTQNVSMLRRALGDGSAGRNFIETVPRRGYRFVAEVRHLQEPQHEVLFQRRTRLSCVTEEEEEAVDRERQPMAAEAAVEDGARAAHAGVGRRAVAAVIAAAGVFALGVGLWRLAPLRRETLTPERFNRMTIVRLTDSGKVTAGAISPDEKYVVHAVSEAGLQSLLVKQISTGSSIQIVPPAPVDYWGVTLSPDGSFVYCVTWERTRTDAVLYRLPMLGGMRQRLMQGVDGTISFSPDGRRLVFGTSRFSKNESLLMIANADGSERRTFVARSGGELFNGSNAGGPVWSPDGSVIASALGRTISGYRRQRLVQVALENPQPQPIGSQLWINMGRTTWLTDGSGLLITARERVESPEQIWLVSYPGGEAMRVTNDLHDYSHVSVTADGRVLAAVQTQTVTTIWVAPSDDPNRGREIFSEVGSYKGTEGLSWTPEGRLVYRSHAGGGIDLWVMDVDGSNRRQLTSHAGANFHPAVSSDGRFLAFASDRSGRLSLWLSDLDGARSTQLTQGPDDVRPQITPDGRWIVYQQGHGVTRSTIWKAPVAGGEPVQLTSAMSIRPAVSPDGRFAAYYYMDAERWRLAVMSIDGAPVASFDIPPTSGSRVVRWTPDGRALAYLDERGGVSNILVQRLDGGPPQQLTQFQSGQLVFFNWSPDGKQLALVRAEETSNVVRISHFRP